MGTWKGSSDGGRHGLERGVSVRGVAGCEVVVRTGGVWVGGVWISNCVGLLSVTGGGSGGGRALVAIEFGTGGGRALVACEFCTGETIGVMVRGVLRVLSVEGI